MLFTRKMTRGSKVTLTADIHSTIEVQVHTYVVFTGIALGFSYDKPITRPLIP